MYGKEKEFTSFDSQGPTDFDVVGFHLDTIDDILRLIKECHTVIGSSLDLYKPDSPCTSEKLDELKHYTEKLKRYIKN